MPRNNNLPKTDLDCQHLLLDIVCRSTSVHGKFVGGRAFIAMLFSQWGLLH